MSICFSDDVLIQPVAETTITCGYPCKCGGTAYLICMTSIPPWYAIQCPSCGKRTANCHSVLGAERAWRRTQEERDETD